MTKKAILLHVFIFLCSTYLYSQNKSAWQKIDDHNVKGLKKARQMSGVMQDHLYALDLNLFKSQLYSHTSKNKHTKKSLSAIYFPNMQGELDAFYVEEASVLSPKLQEKYPDIRSYVGRGIGDSFKYIRFSISSEKGVSALIVSRESNESFIIEPISDDYKIVTLFKKSGLNGIKDFQCRTQETKNSVIEAPRDAKNFRDHGNNNNLRVFKLAMAVTGEYSVFHGGTLSSVNAAINATLTRVNGILENDFNVRLVLIDTNDAIVYLNPETDPFPKDTGRNNDPVWGMGGSINSDLQRLLERVIGLDHFDIGHLLAGHGGTGNAGCIGCICDRDRKGSGYTTSIAPVGDIFDIDYVVHEIGHQLGAGHTFTSINEGTMVQVEPGSGSTIMGYAGITNYNVQKHSDSYFHAVSIEQVMTTIASKTCEVLIPTENSTPICDAGKDIILPIGTPFKLTGEGSDPDHDPITYCWEQIDRGSQNTTIPNPYNLQGPMFRSYPPSLSSTRYFPKFEDVLSNGANGMIWEKLPLLNRTITFRLTVRDNKIGGASTSSRDKKVTFDTKYGPFQITSIGRDSNFWNSGEDQIITWDVNNTTALSGSKNVTLFLSVDGGLTFPIVLAQNVPNTGRRSVVAPNVKAPFCRVMIVPEDHIYYAISENLSIGTIPTVEDVCKTYRITPQKRIRAHYSTDLESLVNIIDIPDDVVIKNLEVSVNIAHPYISDLQISLLKPNFDNVNDGRSVYLRRCDGTYSNINTTFTDTEEFFSCRNINNSGKTMPTYELDYYKGMSAKGKWGVMVKNDGILEGVLNSIDLKICFESVTLENRKSKNLFVYPNPCVGNFTLAFSPSGDHNVLVYIYDMNGRQVFEETYEKTTAFMQNIIVPIVETGIYMVVVHDGNDRMIKKLSIKN